MVKIILKPSSPTLRPDHPKEYQVLARTNNLFYAQYVKEHVVLRQKKLIKPQRFKQQIVLSKGLQIYDEEEHYTKFIFCFFLKNIGRLGNSQPRLDSSILSSS